MFVVREKINLYTDTQRKVIVLKTFHEATFYDGQISSNHLSNIIRKLYVDIYGTVVFSVECSVDIWLSKSFFSPHLYVKGDSFS